MSTALYAEAWQNPGGDPLRQLHAMLGIMEGFTERPGKPCVCAVGMMAQELAATHPEVREHCARELVVWTENVPRLLTAARERHRPARPIDPEEVAWFLNSLWQGSMLVGKARQSPETIRNNLRLARESLDGLFVT